MDEQKRRFSPEEAAQICARYQTGESVRHLATTLNCAYETISKILTRNNIPLRTATNIPLTPERFWAKVDQSGGPGACWCWTGGHLPSGYGRVKLNGRETYSHRVAYELVKGPITPGYLIRHTCDNPPCCNPAHLLEGTDADNMRDKTERGRHGSLGKAGQIKVSKFTLEQIQAIRARYAVGNISLSQIARDYNCSPGTIRAMVCRQTYIDV